MLRSYDVQIFSVNTIFVYLAHLSYDQDELYLTLFVCASIRLSVRASVNIFK